MAGSEAHATLMGTEVVCSSDLASLLPSRHRDECRGYKDHITHRAISPILRAFRRIWPPFTLPELEDMRNADELSVVALRHCRDSQFHGRRFPCPRARSHLPFIDDASRGNRDSIPYSRCKGYRLRVYCGLWRW
jgi:hypothetical protein